MCIRDRPKIGQITSSRNSGVIHAGVYYQPKSLKSKLCVEGNKLLYEYAKKFNVSHINTKKIIVANNDLQMHQVQQIKVQAETNGVENLELIDEKQVNQLEPLIKSTGGLLVSSTGVIDQHTLMQSYLGEFENNGGMISYNSNVKKIFNSNLFFLSVAIPRPCSGKSAGGSTAVRIHSNGEIKIRKVPTTIFFCTRQNVMQNEMPTALRLLMRSSHMCFFLFIHVFVLNSFVFSTCFDSL